MTFFERLRLGRTSVRQAIPGLIAGAAVCGWLGFGKAEPIQAQANAARSAMPETIAIAVSSNPAGSAQFVIVDSKAKTFAVYEVDQDKKVKLLAARAYEWDHRIEYNNLPPSVRDIEQTVKSKPATPR